MAIGTEDGQQFQTPFEMLDQHIQLAQDDKVTITKDQSRVPQGYPIPTLDTSTMPGSQPIRPAYFS